MRKWGRNNDKLGHINKEISLENRSLNGEFGLQREEVWVTINDPTTSEYLISGLATIWFITSANGMSIMIKEISELLTSCVFITPLLIWTRNYYFQGWNISNYVIACIEGLFHKTSFFQYPLMICVGNNNNN